MEGMYLQLFHGRKSPDEVLEDWGADGPVFGPLSYVHTTYSSHIKLGEPDEPFDNLGDLFVVNDLLYYDGVYYGDWSVFGESQLDVELRRRNVPFVQAKAELPAEVPPARHLDYAFAQGVGQLLDHWGVSNNLLKEVVLAALARELATQEQLFTVD